MDQELLQRVAVLAREMREVLVATADAAGQPHMSVGEQLAIRGPDTVSLFMWSCPQTLSNLQEDRSISLVVWDDRSDEGYQLLDEVHACHDHSVLDGYIPSEAPESAPQVEHELQIRISSVMRFSHFAHEDVPLGK